MPTSLCPVFESCGACFFPPAQDHSAYLKSLETKTQKVLNLLHSNPHSQAWEATRQASWMPQKKLHYRYKSIYPLNSLSPKQGVGFFAAQTHQVVTHKNCFIQHPEYTAIAEYIAQIWPQLGLSFADDSLKSAPKKAKKPAAKKIQLPGKLRGVYFRTNPENQHQLSFLLKAGLPLENAQYLGLHLLEKFPQIKSIWLNIQKESENVWLGPHWQHLAGSARLPYRVQNKEYQLHPASFFQVNPEALEYLCGLVQQSLSATEKRQILDLFCGIGILGYSALQELSPQQCAPEQYLCGVELNAQAIKEAQNYQKIFKLPQAQFIQSECETVWAKIRQLHQQHQFNTIIVDPPRQGLDKQSIDGLAQLQTPQLFYVSCLPKTWWRDGLELQNKGYRLKTWHLMDFFPWTEHLEVFSSWEYQGS